MKFLPSDSGFNQGRRVQQQVPWGQRSQRDNGGSNQGKVYQVREKDNPDMASGARDRGLTQGSVLCVESGTTTIDYVHSESGDRSGMPSRDNNYEVLVRLDENIMSRNHLGHWCIGEWKYEFYPRIDGVNFVTRVVTVFFLTLYSQERRV